MKRIFIALTIPNTNKDEIERGVRHIRIPNMQWIPKEKWHLTLAFLGDKTREEIEIIHQSLQHVAKHTAPFSYHTDSVIAFGHQNTPRLVLKIVPEPDLVALQKKVVDAIHQEETRPFTPHVTLGKLRHKSDCEKSMGIKTVTCKAEKIAIIHSILHDHGSDYFPIAEFQLSTKQIEPHVRL